LRVERELLSRWCIQHGPEPDFARLRQAILRQGIPDRLPLFEVNIDDEVLSAILGEQVQNPGYVGRRVQREADQDKVRRYVQQQVRAWYHLGYDCIVLPVFLPMASAMLIGQDTAGLPRQTGRAWVSESRGPVTNWGEFERFAWRRVEDADCSMLEHASAVLPDGMGLVVRTRGVMEWLMRLVGFETLGYAIADGPELVKAISERVGTLVVGLVQHLAQMDGMSAIVLYDDMGFRTSTFLSPADLRKYVLPWTRRCAQVTHAQGLPFILHSCGNLEGIMEDVIADVRVDAKHSFEDIIMPMPAVKAKYGQHMGILGGVDMHILAAGTEEMVRAATRHAIQTCAPGGGYVFGSGNTIANYVPLGNYLAMLDEAKKLGWVARSGCWAGQ